MFDERFARERAASLLTDCVDVVCGQRLDAVEMIPVRAIVYRIDHRPGRSVPMFGQRVPEPCGILLSANSPHIGVGDGSHSIKNVLQRSWTRAGNYRPDAAVEVFDQRLLLEFAAYVITHRPSKARTRHRDRIQGIFLLADVGQRIGRPARSIEVMGQRIQDAIEPWHIGTDRPGVGSRSCRNAVQVVVLGCEAVAGLEAPAASGEGNPSCGLSRTLSRNRIVACREVEWRRQNRSGVRPSDGKKIRHQVSATAIH